MLEINVHIHANDLILLDPLLLLGLELLHLLPPLLSLNSDPLDLIRAGLLLLIGAVLERAVGLGHGDA